MSSGAKVVTAYIREQQQGVTPSGAWNLITRTSFGVGPTYNTTENNEIGEDRMAQGTTQTTVDVGGDVVTKMRYRALDDFLASCFGSEWTSSNTLTMGNDRITFSLGYYANDVGIAGKATGAQVTSMAFSVPNDGEIEVTTTFGATGWQDKADDTSYIQSITKEKFDRRYSFINVRNLKLNGVQVGDNNMCVDTFNLQFDNAAQTQRCIGTGKSFAGNIIATKFTPSGSITLSWAKAAYELWKKQETNSAISFEFELFNEDGFYTFLIPEMEVSGSWPDGGAEDIIQVELNFTARRTPPIITRQAPAAESVIVTLPATTIEKNTNIQATSRVLPTGASQAVTWSSEDSDIASVSTFGRVTGVGVGETRIVATAAGLSGVSGSVSISVTDIEPDSVTVTLAQDSIEVNQTSLASATVEPDGAPQSVAWASSDSDVATVDSDGLVSGISVGTATITATSNADESISGSAEITINRESPRQVLIDLDSNRVAIDATEQATASVVPAGAEQSVTWSVSNPEILSISEDGLITGKATGTASIVAKSTANADIQASETLTVFRPGPSSIVVSVDKSTVDAGKTTAATAEVKPEAALQSVNWSSSDMSILTVSSAGLVTARSPGTASVIATSTENQEISGSTAVQVTQPDPESLTVSLEQSSVTIGDTSQATATVEPPEASQSVTWSSSDESVATVDDTGLVTSVASGTADIKATSTVNEDVSSTATLTVERPDVESVSVSIDSDAIDVDATSQASATVNPSDADQSVTWSSDDESVATVDDSGLVTGIAAGSATITATSSADESKYGNVSVTVSESASRDRSNGGGDPIVEPEAEKPAE